MRGEDKDYQKLIYSQRWKNLRLWYFKRHPLCERCLSFGITRQAEEVHHIVPISSGKIFGFKEKLAFDKDNLMSLCKECHHLVHEGKRAVLSPETKEFMDIWLK